MFLHVYKPHLASLSGFLCLSLFKVTPVELSVGIPRVLQSIVTNFFMIDCHENTLFFYADQGENSNADANVLVNPSDGWLEQESYVKDGVAQHLGQDKIDAVLNMAGNDLLANGLRKVYTMLS
jgi:hypothetical protein